MFYQENPFVSSTSRRFFDKCFIKKIPLLAVVVEDSLDKCHYQENSFVSSSSRRFSDKCFNKKIPLLAVLVEDSLINVLTRKFLC